LKKLHGFFAFSPLKSGNDPDPYPDPHSFSKPWIRIRKIWMRIRNPAPSYQQYFSITKGKAGISILTLYKTVIVEGAFSSYSTSSEGGYLCKEIFINRCIVICYNSDMAADQLALHQRATVTSLII